MTDQNDQTDRPEVDDPRVLALAKARQQMANENPFNAGFCPPWDGLSEQEQRLSLLDARSYLRAALNAGLVATPAVPAPATDQAALRDRIRRAVCEANGFDFDSDMLEPDEYGDHADMILAVLPAVADLAELTKQIDLRDYWHAEAMSATTRIIELEGQLEESRRAAVVPADLAEQRADTAARDADIYQQRLERLSEGYTEQRKRAEEAERIRENADFHLGQEMARRQLAEKETDRLRAVVARLRQMTDYWEQQLPDVIRTPAVVSAIRAALEAADDPSRMAGETQQPTPCSEPNGCDPDGDLCDRHETERAHAEGEHCFCGPECDKACTCAAAGDAFVPLGHYADCPQAAAVQQPKEA